MGNCSSAPRLKVNLRAFIAANPAQEGYGDDWYFETMNVLLDRWTNSHVQFLRKKFLEATGDKGEKELDKKGFYKLFAELQDMPKAVAESAFRMFDTDNSGKLNFREFCCALALCCHLMSSDDEKIRFVFDMFDTNDDGLLSSADVQLLLEYAFQKDDPNRGLEGVAADGDKERRQQNLGQMKQELLGNHQQLTFERFYEWAMKNIESLTNLLHTFQIVPTPERERTICEEILSRHQTLVEDGTWYCISYKWLQVWKAHANWRGAPPGRQTSTTSLNTGYGLLVAQGDHLARQTSDSRDRRPDVELQDLDDAASEIGLGVPFEPMSTGHHNTARPPEIDNSDLEGEHKGELKMNLVEHLDYQLIPEEMWHRLVEWYGGGPAIPRKVICMGEDHQPQVELYPPLVLVVAAGESGQPLPQFSRRFFISRQTSLEEVLHMLAERLSRPEDRSRLWHRAKGEQWHPVNQMSMMLDEFLEGKVWDAGAFMLETQKLNAEWPRDSMSQPFGDASETWSVGDAGGHFEVGDRVEAQNGVTNQWTRGTIVDVIQRDHSTAPSQVKVHYDSTVYKCDEWISTCSDRLAPLDTHMPEHPSSSSTALAKEGPSPIRGATGLQNLGNTCFLNATIQCLANTPLMREYFLSMQYMRDINETSKMGCKGRLAEEFGHVLSELWASKTAGLSPRNLKRTIDQFAPQFAGYEQHDAQELLAFFLDGLHEDLNRITPIPTGSGGRLAGLRREAGTPKLFSRGNSRGKPRHASPMPSSQQQSPGSPLRGSKTAWRDRAADRSRAGAGALRGDTTAGTSGNVVEAPSLGSSSVSCSPAQEHSGLGFDVSPLVPKEQGLDDEHRGAIEGTSADPGAMEDGVDDLSMSSDLPDDEAYRKVERLVHPTMLWSRPRPGGGFGNEGSAENGMHSGEDLPLSAEETLPSNPKVSSPGLSAIVGLGRGADEYMPQQPAAHEEVSVQSILEAEVRDGAGHLPRSSSKEGAMEATDSSVLELTEEFGDDRMSQDLSISPLHRVNECRSVQAAASSFQQPLWQRRQDEEPGDKAKDGREALPAEAAAVAAPLLISDEVRPSSQPSTATTDRRQQAGDTDHKSASRPSSGRRDDTKRQGTSRWWSFAWRRGHNDLELPANGRPDSASSTMSQDEARKDAQADQVSKGLEAATPASASALAEASAAVASVPQEDNGNIAAPSGNIVALGSEATLPVELQKSGADLQTPEASEAGGYIADIGQLDEFRLGNKLPAGTAVAAVTASQVLREAKLHSQVSNTDVSEDGTVGTFNESEDFVPELLTPTRPSSSGRSSFNLFSRSFRRKKDNDSSTCVSPNTRRSRTPPTMTPLHEVREEALGVVADERPAYPMERGRDDFPGSSQVAQESFHETSGTTMNTEPGAQGSEVLAGSAPASSTRSFLPWKGKRNSNQAGSREASVEDEDESTRNKDGRATSTERTRGGRTKDKESSWPSFLRRSKSREGSVTRRTGRGPRAPGFALAPLNVAGDTGAADEGYGGLGQADSRPSSDEGVRAERRDLSEPRSCHSSAESGNEDSARPVRPTGLGMFLRAPWKREARSGISPSKRGSSPHLPRDASPDEAERARVLGGNAHQDGGEPSEGTSRDDPAYAEARKGLPSAQEAPPETPRDSTRDSPGAEATAQVPQEPSITDVGKESLNASITSEDRGDAAAESAAAKTRTTDEPQADNEEDAETDEDNLPDEEKAARQWERYRSRNRSLIVDIFEGQLRSQLTCTECGTSSSTFEPFRYLSVPIPSNHVDRASLRVVFFPLPFSNDEERPRLQRFSVCVPKSSTVQKVEKALSRILPVPMTSVLLAEVYRSRIHRYLDTTLPISDVRAEDQLFAFEVLQSPNELMQYQERHAPSRQRREKVDEIKREPRVLFIQAMHRRVVDVQRSDGRTWAQRREVFGLPFVMSAASSWTYATLHDMLMLHARRFLRSQRRDRQSNVSDDRQAAQMPFVARIVNASGTACGACDRRNCTGCLLPKGNSRLRLRSGLLTGSVSTAKIYLALDWVDSGVYDQDYVDAVVDDASVARASATGCDPDDADTDRCHTGSDDTRGTGKVAISTCIDAFAQPEEMKEEFGNGVKCEKCNKVVDTVKKMEIWREPDVLIIHIKRFQFSGVHYEKLNTPVELTEKELNLRPWIVGPMATNSAPYELYAVACHSGGMSGGHYTSYCANQEGKEPVWLKFNDDVVNSVSLVQELDEIAKQCYVLFYRKRAFSSSNLINYSSLL